MMQNIFIKRFWFHFILGGALSIYGAACENKSLVIIAMVLISVSFVLAMMGTSNFIREHLEYVTTLTIKTKDDNGKKDKVQFNNTCKSYDVEYAVKKLNDLYYVYFLEHVECITRGPNYKQKVYLNLGKTKLLLFYLYRYSPVTTI